MKLTPTQIVGFGVSQISAAQNLCTQLDQALQQITQHNADKNNTAINAGPLSAALAAGQTIVNSLASHIAQNSAPAK